MENLYTVHLYSPSSEPSAQHQWGLVCVELRADMTHDDWLNKQMWGQMVNTICHCVRPLLSHDLDDFIVIAWKQHFHQVSSPLATLAHLIGIRLTSWDWPLTFNNYSSYLYVLRACNATTKSEGGRWKCRTRKCRTACEYGEPLMLATMSNIIVITTVNTALLCHVCRHCCVHGQWLPDMQKPHTHGAASVPIKFRLTISVRTWLVT